MKNLPPIIIDSHNARIIAGMLRSYTRLLSVPPTKDPDIDSLLGDEAEQAMAMRKMLLDACANEKRRVEA